MTDVFDIAIKGLLYDGSGSTPAIRTIGIKDGLIVFLGSGQIEAACTIDATNLVIAPGFIDVHTHSDVSLLLDGRGQSKVYQGVTTEVTGNCSFSAFPINHTYLKEHADFLAGIGDDRIDLSWQDLEGYRKALHESGIAINVAPLVGHGTLRIAAMGLSNSSITDDEILSMQELLIKSIEQGAFGMSTGLTYVPSGYSSFKELQALCEVLKRYNRTYATHSRDSDILGDDPFLGPLNEALELSRKTGVRIQFSHAAINNPSLWGSAGKWTDHFANAVSNGLDAAFDVYPYDASSSALTQYLPTWVQEGGVDQMKTRLADEMIFEKAAKELSLGWSANLIPWDWSRVLLARTDSLLDTTPGDSVLIAAEKLKIEPERLVLELCKLGGNQVMVVLFYRTEEDMRTFARSPHSMICSDGSAIPFDQGNRIPHPRSFGASTRAIRLLSRENKDLALESVIHKMTGKVAEHLNIEDRGTIEIGKAADIVIFDSNTVSDGATFLDPAQPPIGIHYVIVNGEIVIEKGVQTNARPGRVLNANSASSPR
jgi:N-acyl-D-amino-acid deacylase